MAKLATVNGVIPTAPGSLITYGSVPNNPKVCRPGHIKS